jgi:hypothetical protein
MTRSASGIAAIVASTALSSSDVFVCGSGFCWGGVAGFTGFFMGYLLEYFSWYFSLDVRWENSLMTHSNDKNVPVLLNFCLKTVCRLDIISRGPPTVRSPFWTCELTMIKILPGIAIGAQNGYILFWPSLF